MQSVFSSCSSLLSHLAQRVITWIVSCLVIAENLYTLYTFQPRQGRQTLSRIHMFHTRQLSIADCLTGLYLLAICIVNLIYDGKIILIRRVWKNSVMCKLLALLPLISLELSFSMILLMSFDRFLAMQFAMKNIRLSAAHSLKLAAYGWLSSITIALLYLMEQTLKLKKMPNPLCFAMINIDFGNDVVLTILFSYNCLLVLLIVAINIGTLRVVLGSLKSTQLRRSRKTSSSVPLRIIAVIVGNISWWCIVSSYAVSTYAADSSLSTQAWVVVLAVPINAIINPILNIFSTKKFYGKIKKYFKI